MPALSPFKGLFFDEGVKLAEKMGYFTTEFRAAQKLKEQRKHDNEHDSGIGPDRYPARLGDS